MITLTLLHPSKTIPLQHWTFENNSIIRVGRSLDNNVVLYSAVVSRHHVEIRKSGSNWELENFGANGTYLNGKPVTKASVIDGMVFRLATSGPQIQIRILPDSPQSDHFASQIKPTSTTNEERHKKETITSYEVS
ncbi:FHA domain-containing protein [Aphanothece hegewaldii CCALA 016]|uniref:FHA domain-containing protein n=1 Tax=Aphanothece hegewaldii CCALA 016 TaxID=2107694 RepID=A0A2T1LWD8_9CHRO|nr:FHA domain-containing protein [Aphanothece hegewaldii]PSF36118.1 FHA domain-containing protein [Aphanothece hegewaldii CCALA 016]